MRNIKLWQSSLTLLTAVGFGGCVAEDARDLPDPAQRSGEPSPRASDCITSTVATPWGKPATDGAAAPAVQCFASFSEAMAAATQGRVQLPASATAATVDERTLNAGAQASSGDFVIGIEYIDINYGGASLIAHSATTCDGFNHGFGDLRVLGWNDQISSARAFSDCNNAFHYEDIDFTGAMINCGSGCSFIGAAMNDQTSSLLWTH